jgi:hypothetical protein
VNDAGELNDVDSGKSDGLEWRIAEPISSWNKIFSALDIKMFLPTVFLINYMFRCL